MPKKLKQAVLLIHGIGEQRPMDTLRGFVDTVWTTDEQVKHENAVPGVFSKPDEISGSFELRRLTTTKNRKGVRTDFYEFYWAHLMSGTILSHVIAWSKRLLFRWPWQVPPRLRGAWLLLIGLLLIIGFFALQAVIPENYQVFSIPKWLSGIIGILAAGVAVPIINNIIGDAARYLDPAPSNIHRREEIRTKGVNLLNKLHESNKYDRIMVVGHSLGSVIGYDILTYAWSRYNKSIDNKNPHPKLDEFEDLVHSDERLAHADFQSKQQGLQAEFNENGINWLVTDFLTLGSPLTHAEILLAKNKKDLTSKQKERELPTCPPELESGKFSYPSKFQEQDTAPRRGFRTNTMDKPVFSIQLGLVWRPYWRAS